MTTEHDLAHGRGAPRAPSPADDDLMPGRGSRSSQLAAPSHPIAGGLLLRKARDANGVAEDADQAVAAAASGSGHPLPQPILRKFESSLGADLSSVRVHTGGESQTAAKSVSAKAYTLGQDIHFAAGQYDPSSGAGQHLLAHEVAHTVQQRGGAPMRQNQLEVSMPGDTLEQEADHAADAMVSGAPTLIHGSGSGVGRKVMRETPGAAAQGAGDKEADGNARPSKVPGHWQPPFDLPACNDRPGACVALVDIAKKLQDLKAAGFDECQIVIDNCNAQANSLAGNDPLTKDEADQLSALGFAAKASHDFALNDMKQRMSAELAKWTSDSDFSAAQDQIAEELHSSFAGNSGKNKLTELKELSGKMTSLAGKIKKYAGWAGKAKGQIAAAQKLEDLSKSMGEFTSILGDANEVIELTESIATLTGKINEKPGGTQNDIAKIQAGLSIVDFAISKSKVPLIGDYWKSVIKPCADLALAMVGKLDKIAEGIVKMPMFDDWWHEAQGGGAPPQLFSSPLEKSLWSTYFPGGQPMLDFMWGLMKDDVTTVPHGIESYFIKFKAQFNAGHADSDAIKSQSNWHLLHPSSWGDSSSPNLVAWLNANKSEAWAMIYGSLPHP